MCYTHRTLKHGFNLIWGLYQRLLWHSDLPETWHPAVKTLYTSPFGQHFLHTCYKVLIENLASCVVIRDPVNYNSIINGFIILFFTTYLGGEGYCIHLCCTQAFKSRNTIKLVFLVLYTYIYVCNYKEWFYTSLKQKMFLKFNIRSF